MDKADDLQCLPKGGRPQCKQQHKSAELLHVQPTRGRSLKHQDCFVVVHARILTGLFLLKRILILIITQRDSAKSTVFSNVICRIQWTISNILIRRTTLRNTLRRMHLSTVGTLGSNEEISLQSYTYLGISPFESNGANL